MEMEMDPEFGKTALAHMESTAIPIETVLKNIPERLRNFWANQPVQDGAYVRDGDGGISRCR